MSSLWYVERNLLNGLLEATEKPQIALINSISNIQLPRRTPTSPRQYLLATQRH